MAARASGSPVGPRRGRGASVEASEVAAPRHAPRNSPLPRKAFRVPEKVVQQQIVHLLRSLGGVVWVLGTRRPRGDYQGTAQTPGIGDLFAVLRGRALWVECKAAGGRLRPEQAVFRDAVLQTPCHHLVGGVDEVIQWCVREGLLRSDCVPHYRQVPGEAS